MAIAMRDAMRAGLVSGKAAGKHKLGLSKKKDEGHPRNKGAVHKGSIDARDMQHTGKGLPTKGGGVGSSYAPGAKMIDQWPEDKRGARAEFPPESKVHAALSSKQANINPKSRGPIPKSGGRYGGGGKDTQ